MYLPVWSKVSEAEAECYDYFDVHIRPLKKLKSGKVNPSARGLADNDVDAFRHAYVSGVMTQLYGEEFAEWLGWLNEHSPPALLSNSSDPRSRNMDLWNNAVGRKYGKKTRTRKSLLRKIHEALKNGELIVQLKDRRRYTAHTPKNDPSKPIITISETETGRNVLFFDREKKVVMTRAQFVAAIGAGKYSTYIVKKVRGVSTPASNPDAEITNNLT